MPTSIAGIGLDTVDRARFQRLLDDPGSAFAAGTFTPAVRFAAASRVSGDPTQHLAARYAAEQACSKALSQALRPAPLPSPLADLAEIEVLCDDDQRPALVLHGRLRALADAAGIVALHVSLSHDGPVATAVVIAER